MLKKVTLLLYREYFIMISKYSKSDDSKCVIDRSYYLLLLNFHEMKVKRISAILLFLITVMVSGCITDEPERSLKAGDALPQFSVTSIEGRTYSSADAEDRVMVIVFFNTTCIDCQRELPEVQAVYEQVVNSPELREKVEIICIAREESAEDILNYWHAHNLTLPASAQNDRKVYNLFANIGIPRIYIACRGEIVATELSIEILRQTASNIL